MSKLLVLLAVVGVLACTKADPEPYPNAWMNNPALDMLQRMNQFPMLPLMNPLNIPPIRVMTPEELASNLKSSGQNVDGVATYMSSSSHIDENGNVVKSVKGETVYKDGDKIEVQKFGNKD